MRGIKALLAAGAVTAAASVLLLTAVPAYAVTPRYIASTGEGLCLDVQAYVIGAQLGFSQAACGSNPSPYSPVWDFQVDSSGLYEIHPSYNDGLDLTLSTTQPGVSRIEYRVGSGGASNQVFQDISEGNDTYLIYNQSFGVYLNDPHANDPNQHVSGTVQSCPGTSAGCNLLQFAPS
jgi:hypothetical protein